MVDLISGSEFSGHVHKYVNGTLQTDEPLNADDSQFLLWFPWKKPKYQYHINKQGEECVERPHEGSSIDEFPADMFTRKYTPTMKLNKKNKNVLLITNQ